MGNAVQLMMIPELDAERSDKATAIIQRQLKQLVRLVDDLLDVSRITRGQLQLRTTPNRASRDHPHGRRIDRTGDRYRRAEPARPAAA